MTVFSKYTLRINYFIDVMSFKIGLCWLFGYWNWHMQNFLWQSQLFTYY